MTLFRSAGGSSIQRELRWICVYKLIRRGKFVLVGLLAVGWTFVRQAPAQVQQPDIRQSSVHGTVVNAATQQPIGRALVYSPDDRFATLTDSEGHFEFTLPKVEPEAGGGAFVLAGPPRQLWPTGSASGLFLLMARKPGFLDDPRETTQVTASPGSELTISLMPEAVIKGRVTISAADAAIGINVQIFSRQVEDGIPRWVQGASMHTNSNGEFRFAELLPGAYKLVTHEWMDNDPAATLAGDQPLYGFPPVYYANAADFPAAGTIQLAAGQTFEANFSPVRQHYYPVRIPVANAEANSGMNITVSVQGHRGPGYSLGYNAVKQRIEGLLPNGNYLVEGMTFGPTSSTGSVNLVVAGTPAEGPSMVLNRNSSIILNVKEEFTATDGNGSGSWSNGGQSFSIHGPRLYLQVGADAADDFEPHGASLRQPTGPNDDSLVLEDLPPGRYWLRLHSSRGYVASATLGSLDLLHEPFVIGSGSSEPIEIKMRDDSAEIEGTLAGMTAASTATESQGSPGRSTPPAYVYCFPLPDSSGQFLEFSTSSDGTFSSRTVAPGTYRVIAFRSQQRNLPYRDPEAMRAYETKGQVVHLSPGQKESLQLRISSGSE